MPKIRNISFRYNKKNIVIYILIILVVALSVYSIYKSYAYYEVSSSYNIIKGKVGEFSRGDIKLAIYLEDSYNSNTFSNSNLEAFPSKADGYVYKETICDPTGSITTNYDAETNNLSLSNINIKTKCNVYFTRLNYFSITVTTTNATPASTTLSGYAGLDSSSVVFAPNSGKSYAGATCTGGTPNWNNTTKTFKLTNLTGNGTCTIKFRTAGDTVLATWTTNSIPINSTTPSFSSTATTQVGVYSAPDDYGTSYYVRGSANYNFVKFGKDASGNDYWWRIIRINGDGSVRMIYQGTAASGSTPALTGTSTQINSSTYTFNSTRTNNMHVGYMYTSGQRQGLGTSSNAKTTLESWYKTNFVDRATNATARNYIADRIFCGDRTSSTSSSTTWTTPFTSTGGTGSTTTYYGAYLRLINSTKSPTLICPEDPDKYTTVSSDHGNKSLTYPIGLITADEVWMAGGTTSSNSSYYLYTGQYYWTMSPYYFNGGTAREWYVDSSGYLHSDRVVSSSGLRAVINLSPESPISGAGTTTLPFTIE